MIPFGDSLIFVYSGPCTLFSEEVCWAVYVTMMHGHGHYIFAVGACMVFRFLYRRLTLVSALAIGSKQDSLLSTERKIFWIVC